ncbi:hypothetical protein [Paraburkholderia kirstenboschensis]|uniref:Uncharacterized protein n=1 Tax=Paraburkholderia kirstenboschensis TaxID=1245436 RepID=A0ABZ0EP79_9BURK|nr:hypothetical protein [Paraburkholderia kirstenboschensis]WOD18979.1 hypothetical protein RW095_40615 [Paraburkholderia kirstenboschensis]
MTKGTMLKKIKDGVVEFVAGPDLSDVEVPKKFIGQMSPEEVKAEVDRTVEALREQGARVDEWALEVLKHLILMNAAGLAGTFTLYQVQGIERSFWPTVIFLAGLISAFLSLMLGWHLHRRMLFGTITGFLSFIGGKRDSAFMTTTLLSSRYLGATVIVFACLSGAIFLAGAVDLYVLVRSTSLQTESRSIDEKTKIDRLHAEGRSLSRFSSTIGSAQKTSRGT